MQKIFIGSPVRNRGWILDEHLDSLFKQVGIEATFCYIVNNCTDNTESILGMRGVPYKKHDVVYPTVKWERGGYSFDDIALTRNIFLEEFLKSDCDYLFSIDSDVILQTSTAILDLINTDKDIVSALLNNSPVIFAHNILINGKRVKKLTSGIMSVDTTGAVYLIKRKVIEAGVRYGVQDLPDKNKILGEDFVFCEHARALGFKSFCNTDVHATHAYAPGQYLVPNKKESV